MGVAKAQFPNDRGNDMYELWVSVALLGLWSCVGVLYNNSRKASKQMDEVLELLRTIAQKP